MKKIAWEKWVDFDEEVSEENFLDIDSISDDQDLKDEGMNSFKIVPLMVRTPLGSFSPYEPLNPSVMFDCWVFHTNFDITPKEIMLLDMIEGIESLKVMSRYRVFIGIGKLFSIRDVRQKIEKSLGVIPYELSNLIEIIKDKKQWAVGFFEDGTHTIIHSENDPDQSYDAELESLINKNPVNIVSHDDF